MREEENFDQQLREIAEALVADAPDAPPFPASHDAVVAIDSGGSQRNSAWRQGAVLAAAAALILIAGFAMFSRFRGSDTAITTPVIAAEPRTEIDGESKVPEQQTTTIEGSGDSEDEPESGEANASVSIRPEDIADRELARQYDELTNDDLFRPTWIGIEPSAAGAQFGYVALTTSESSELMACDAEPVEQLMVFELGTGGAGLFPAGLRATGNLSSVTFSDQHPSAFWISLKCQNGDVIEETPEYLVQLDDIHPPATLGISRWGRFQNLSVAPDHSFAYGSTAHPTGAKHCYADASFPAVRGGDSAEQPAIREINRTFGGLATAYSAQGPERSYAGSYRFGSNGAIAFAHSCEVFPRVAVGRIGDDGMLIDLHDVATIDSISNQVQFAFTPGGDSIEMVYWGWDHDTQTRRLMFRNHLLATDPAFAETASPPIELSAPWKSTVDGDGSWYSGRTLSTDPACGSETLYRDTQDGLARVLPIDQEIDRVVDVDWLEGIMIERFEHSLGSEPPKPLETVERHTVVVSTTCPDSYQGRRLWLGSDGPFHFGASPLERVDAPPVAEVVGLSGSEETGYVIDVIDLDGNQAEYAILDIPASIQGRFGVARRGAGVPVAIPDGRGLVPGERLAIPVFDQIDASPRMLVFTRPNTEERLRYPLLNPNDLDAAVAVRIVSWTEDDEWLRVQAPVAPNGQGVWVRGSDFDVAETSLRVEIDIAGPGTLTVYDGHQVVHRVDAIVTGRESRPTPLGVGYVQGITPGEQSADMYGVYRIGIAAYSEVLSSFGEPDGLATSWLHGTNPSELMGQKVTSGEIRIPDDDLRVIVEDLGVGPGVPVLRFDSADPAGDREAVLKADDALPAAKTVAANDTSLSIAPFTHWGG